MAMSRVEVCPDSGRRFLVYDTERGTKTRTGADIRNIRDNRPVVYENIDDSDRCLVHMFELFREMRPADFREADSPFFISIGSTQSSPALIR